MELRDYGIALRRYWTTWVGLTVAGLLCAFAIALSAIPSYQARATVFVAGTGDSTSSSQFVSTRVKSYPDVAVSRNVLEPVIQDLGLSESFDSLRGRVSSSNPPDTSQIEIDVTDGNPQRAAAVANAVANRFGTAVEQLERPATGISPVALTVTDPATVPGAPVFPDTHLMLLLGGVVGVALGVSAAVIRSRVDTRVHDEAGFRAAWGNDDHAPVVLSARPRRRFRGRKHGRLLGDPTTMLVRRLAALGADSPVRVAVLALPEGDGRASKSLVAHLAAELRAEDIGVAVTDDPAGRPADGPAGSWIELRVSSAAAPLREWRQIATRYDGVILAMEPGCVHRAELGEVRSVLSTAGLPLIAVLLQRRRAGVDELRAGTAATPAKRTVGAPAPRATSTTPAGSR
jgi:capsular polysaccharide biosynthesis protein